MKESFTAQSSSLKDELTLSKKRLHQSLKKKRNNYVTL